ncbi:MAG: hypothetical protein ACRD0K_06955 [Egibacteraceae bacterium]
MPPKVIHLSPFEAPTPFFTARREAEIRRIFGPDAKIVHFRDIGCSPSNLAQAIRQHEADAIVLGSAKPGHRRAVMSLAYETLILHPVWVQHRTVRGDREERLAGFGVMREYGAELATDGALTDRSAIIEELAIQRAKRRE